MRIVVAGGTSGIGLATAMKLRDAGHFVSSFGSETDVQVAEKLKRLQLPEPEALVYSVGINELMWTEDLKMLDMLELYRVNVCGLLQCLRTWPTVRRLVVVGSDAAWRPMRTSVAYCASKAALHQMCMCLARELPWSLEAVNVVAPGMTAPTGMSEYVDRRVPELRGWTEEEALAYERTTTERRATPEEVAEIICQTLLAKTDYLNGSVITVNGGRT